MTDLTVYVFDHVDAEAVSGDGGEHLSCAPPPGQVVRGAPGRYGTEQQLQVVLLGQLLCWGDEGAQLHQDLQRQKKKEGRLKRLFYFPVKGIGLKTRSSLHG